MEPALQVLFVLILLHKFHLKFLQYGDFILFSLQVGKPSNSKIDISAHDKYIRLVGLVLEVFSKILIVSTN